MYMGVVYYSGVALLGLIVTALGLCSSIGYLYLGQRMLGLHREPRLYRALLLAVVFPSGLILANISCDFIAQLHHPADLQAGIRVVSIGRSSFKTLAAMYNGEKLVAATRATLVWFDYNNQKSMAVPEDVRQWIRAREKVPPIE